VRGIASAVATVVAVAFAAALVAPAEASAAAEATRRAEATARHWLDARRFRLGVVVSDVRTFVRSESHWKNGGVLTSEIELLPD